MIQGIGSDWIGFNDVILFLQYSNSIVFIFIRIYIKITTDGDGWRWWYIRKI